jgi:hypothetical protein
MLRGEGLFRPSTDKEKAEFFDYLENLMANYSLGFVSGRKHCLLYALDFCILSGTRPPLWAANAWCDAITRWHAARTSTLDEAFELPRPPHGRELNARRDRLELAPLIVAHVARRHRDTGKSITTIIRSMDGMWGLKERTLWDYYHDPDPSIRFLHRAFALAGGPTPPKRVALSKRTAE